MGAISKETRTALEMLEQLPQSYRMVVVEKLRDMIDEIVDEAKWDERFEKHPEPMIEMAEAALAAHKKGETKPLKFD